MTHPPPTYNVFRMQSSGPSPANPPAKPSPTIAFMGSLGSRLVYLIPASMVLGMIAGAVFDVQRLSVLVLPMTMLMVYPMLISFKPRDALTMEYRRPVTLAMVINFVILPLVAFGFAWVFFRGEPSLFVGMILAGLFPTSGMTISWTGFAKGNVKAAVQMTVIGLILASLLAPVYLLVLAGKVVELDIRSVLVTILLVIFVPMLAGTLTRIAIVRARGEEQFRRLVPVYQGISTVGVLAIVFIAIALKARMIIGQPMLLLWVLIPVTLFYVVNYAAAIFTGRLLLPRKDAIAVVYGTVMRNLSIALGLAVASFGAEAALVLAAAFIIQVQSAAWSVKFMNAAFGEPTAKG